MKFELTVIITVCVAIISLFLCGSAIFMAFEGIEAFGWFLGSGIGIVALWGFILYDKNLI